MNTRKDTVAYKAFMATCKGKSAHAAARALNRFTPGVDWRGCAKGWMAEQYASSQEPNALRHHENLKNLNLARLAELLAKV